jgi:hypothetical protein
MGQEMLPLQLQPPTMTLQPLTCRSSPRHEPLEAGHWLRVIESKFGVLRCMEVQKTLFATQQLCGEDSAWWTTYTVTRPADYQVLWIEFRNAFRAYYIPVGVMRKKR